MTFLNRKNSDTDSIVWMREDSAAYCSGKGGKLHRCSLSPVSYTHLVYQYDGTIVRSAGTVSIAGSIVEKTVDPAFCNGNVPSDISGLM